MTEFLVKFFLGAWKKFVHVEVHPTEYWEINARGQIAELKRVNHKSAFRIRVRPVNTKGVKINSPSNSAVLHGQIVRVHIENPARTKPPIIFHISWKEVGIPFSKRSQIKISTL